MFSDNSKTAIGISLLKDTLVWVVMEERKDKQIEIKLLDYVPLVPNINYENLLSQGNRKIIFDTINQAAKIAKFKDFNCFFTLDSYLSFIVKIPIDKRLNDTEFQDHLKWEFDALMGGENYNDYFCNEMKLYHKKPGRPSAALLYFIKKELIVFFENIFDDLNIHLNVVHIDHFAIESVCRINYQEFLSTNSILLSIKNNIIEISLLHKGEFFNYRLIVLKSPSEINEVLEKEFNLIGKQAQELKLGKVFVYAPSLKSGSFSFLMSLMPNHIEIINPFKKLVLNKSILSLPTIKNPNIFVPSIGVALRSFNK